MRGPRQEWSAPRPVQVRLQPDKHADQHSAYCRSALPWRPGVDSPQRELLHVSVLIYFHCIDCKVCMLTIGSYYCFEYSHLLVDANLFRRNFCVIYVHVLCKKTPICNPVRVVVMANHPPTTPLLNSKPINFNHYMPHRWPSIDHIANRTSDRPHLASSSKVPAAASARAASAPPVERVPSPCWSCTRTRRSTS